MSRIHDRVRRVRGRALAGALLAAGLGAGALAAWAPGAEAEAERSAAADEAIPSIAAAKRLLGVEASAAGDGAMVSLRADGRIDEAESFVLENPTRLVVDLPGLVNEGARQRIDVGGTHAARVRVGQHADRVRVVVDGGSDARPFDGHVLVPQADGLLVGIGAEAARLGTGEAPALAARASADDAPHVATRPILPPAPELAPGPIVAPEPALPATDWAQASETSMGEALEAVAYVDMATAAAGTPAVSAAPEAEAIASDVENVEVSETPTLEVAETPAVEGMELAEAVPAAMPVSPAPVGAAMEIDPAAPGAASAARGGAARMHGVQHDVHAGRDRVVLVIEGAATHSILRPDAETLVVSLQNTVLDPGADVRVTPANPGPVSLVTALQMPGSGEPEVRVAVARQPGVEPEVSQRGDLLVLDFPRSEAAAEAALGAGEDMPRLAAASAESPVTAAPEAIVQGSGVIPPAQGATVGSSVEMLKEGGLIGGKTYTGRRISLDFKDVEISDVLRLIAEVSDLNVIAGDEVKGNITIRLTDVPWDQALDVILLTKGLGFVLVGNVLRIAPQETLKAEEAARLEERRAKEKLEDLVVKLQPVNYASVGEVETMIKKLLTPRGSVNIDKRTNTLILKDIQSVVDESVALVKAIDTPTPQVLIESKIVEARLDFSRELGAVWGVGSNPELDNFPFSIPPLDTRQTTTFPFQQPNNVVVQNPITSTANGLLNLGGYILDERFNLTLQLQAAESSGEGKVISSPRVVTLDNREARIEQGVSIPFQTFENGDAQLEFIDAVLSLLVTPHITADKTIIMKIQVTRNAPDPSVPTPTGSPAIAKNEARTETLVKNGQTLVLGGIYVVDRAETSQRVPFLYRIPILGPAFRSQELRDQRRELLIFVTPRIVEPAQS